MSNRISQYFDDDRDQSLYEEICQAGWDGMLNHTLEIWFGVYEDTEDFGFTALQNRRN